MYGCRGLYGVVWAVGGFMELYGNVWGCRMLCGVVWAVWGVWDCTGMFETVWDCTGV